MNDEPKEDTLWSMAREFYSRKMLGVIIIVWTYGLIFIAGAVFSAIRFFDTEYTKFQIMYAAIFVCCIQFIVLMKIFSWQMIHRNSIKRAIRKLELRIGELDQTAKDK